MRPVAEAGLRPIWSHVCASGCARAQASPERMIAILSITRAVLPSSPVGRVTPLKVSGAKFTGVTPGYSLKSNRSTWLGAPRMNRKITLFAEFCGVTLPVVSVAAPAVWFARKKPPTPVRESRKKVLRETWGRSKNHRWIGCRLLMSFSNRSRSVTVPWPSRQ